MYQKKIIAFAVVALVMVFLAGALAIWSTRLTAMNIVQVNMANALLTEHWKLSNNSYRLFKQITDELLFGKNANQALVRNKRELITNAIATISQLEAQQRAAMGEIATKGTVEDTQELEVLINEILDAFDQTLAEPANQFNAERIRFILEEQIDNRFRESINAALQRQSTLVNSLNSNIENIHRNIFWAAALLTILALIAALLGSYTLIRNISIPVDFLKKAAESFADGHLSYRVPRGFDKEFDAISIAFNEMAQKLSEEKLLRDKLNSQLEFEVTKRTNELVKLNETLRKNDVTRRSFLADVSHELRTPLTIIRGETQVALRQNQQYDLAECRNVLASVHEQSLLLSRLVDDLLFIARTDANNLQLKLDLYSVTTLLQDCVNNFQRQAKMHDIKLVCGSQLDDAIINVDIERFKQLMRILFDNAINYSQPHTQVTVTSVLNADAVTISLQDQGPGVADNELPFIFDRFYRSQKMRLEKPTGSGLGLSIAKAICDAHQAKIWAENMQDGLAVKIQFNVAS
ncbi:MAG: HAMP domain-containing sensor histidine kinase [Methylophaga sp.]|nr:HAMP domain-containing sensor histidine kinase [Methylophaga sp.]